MYLVNKGAAATTDCSNKTVGLAAYLLDKVRRWHGATLAPQRKQMKVIETLSLGSKKQLFLVSCNGERFLIGSGPESLQTIVRVRPEKTSSAAIRTVGEELC